MVKGVVRNLNGISVAYMMGLVNALMAMLLAFGLNMTLQQQATVVAFVNAALVGLAHVSHRLGEAEGEHRNGNGAPVSGTTTTTTIPETTTTTVTP